MLGSCRPRHDRLEQRVERGRRRVVDDEQPRHDDESGRLHPWRPRIATASTCTSSARAKDGALLFCNGSGATLETTALIVATVPGALRHPRSRPTRSRPHRDPARPVLHGRLRGRRRRPARPRRLVDLPRRRHQLRRDGRAGAGRHVAGAGRAARAGVHVARRRRRRVVPAARARRPPGDGARHHRHADPRHTVHAGVARDARVRPGAGGADGHAHEHPTVDRAARGENEQLQARRGHDVYDRLPASRARRSSRPVATTASRRPPTRRRSRRRSPAPSCACTRAVTRSSPRTRRRSPT